jgi:SPW repeat-containing protein
MLREGPIPQAVQGLLEYLAGIVFVAAPFVLDFTGNGVATATAIVVGIVFLVLAATSQGPTGLVKQVSPPVHALLDAALAILLVAAPFVLGFSSQATPRNLFLVAGVLWLLITIGSRYDRKPRPAAGPGNPPARSVPDTPRADAKRPGTGAAPSGGGTPGGAPAPGARPGAGGPVEGPGPGGGHGASVAPRPGTVQPGYGPLDGGDRPT